MSTDVVQVAVKPTGMDTASDVLLYESTGAAVNLESQNKTGGLGLFLSYPVVLHLMGVNTEVNEVGEKPRGVRWWAMMLRSLLKGVQVRAERCIRR